MKKGFPATFRKQFGLSQMDVATYLGISQSLVALSEVHERQITGDANIELIKLISLYDEVTPVEELSFIQDVHSSEREAAMKAIEKELKNLKSKLYKTEEVYKKLKEERILLLRRVHVLRKALDTIDEPPSEELRALWKLGKMDKEKKERFLNLRLGINLRKLDAKSLYVLYKKEAEIAAVKHKIAFFENLLEAHR